MFFNGSIIKRLIKLNNLITRSSSVHFYPPTTNERERKRDMVMTTLKLFNYHNPKINERDEEDEREKEKREMSY